MVVTRVSEAAIYYHVETEEVFEDFRSDETFVPEIVKVYENISREPRFSSLNGLVDIWVYDYQQDGPFWSASTRNPENLTGILAEVWERYKHDFPARSQPTERPDDE